jgi:hypothetical protein
MGTMTRQITVTYAYHPAGLTPDLELPTAVVARYQVTPSLVMRKPVSPTLSNSVTTSGFLTPVRIYTDGVFGVLGDGHHRLKIATIQGIPTMPVQVIPDILRRAQHRIALEPELANWVEGNLWIHETHQVTRRGVGQRKPGHFGNAYTRCDCSCGANWKEIR